MRFGIYEVMFHGGIVFGGLGNLLTMSYEFNGYGSPYFF